MDVKEGSAVIRSGVSTLGNSPGTVTPGFFNAVQRLNRDITVLMAFNIRPRLYLDGFTGTGIRAIRVQKEAGVKAVASERNRAAYLMSVENIRENGLDLEIHNTTFESLVSSYDFDFIDVDPYGSAFPYIDVSLNYLRNGGYLGITATDLSALSGSIVSKSLRRYGGSVVNDRMKHEMGIRLLLGYVARRAAGFDRGIEPVISFWHGHYYRIVVRVLQNLRNASESMKHVNYFNKKSSLSGIYPGLNEGPIWTGVMQNSAMIESLEYPDSVLSVREFVEALPHENYSCGFFEFTDFAMATSSDLPSMKHSIERLADSGYNVQRTHFSHTGLKVSDYCEDYLELWNLIKP